MKRRDANIELFRVVCMYGIVLLHAMNDCGHNPGFISSPLQACVCAFVFISGYFGVRFSFAKLFKLYAVGLWCSLVAFVALEVHEFGSMSITYYKFAEFAAFFCKGNWFLHAYAFMMMVAPMVNHVCETAVNGDVVQRKKVVMVFAPFLLLVFGWSAADETPLLSKLMWPTVSGFGDHTPLTLIGIYVVARLYRVFDLGSRITTRLLLLLVPMLAVLACLGFSSYNSIVQVAQGACLFEIFRRIKCINGVCATCISWLAGSMFPVLLLHGHGRFFRVVEAWETALIDAGHSMFFVFFVVSFVIFLASCVIDMPRRVLLGVVRRRISH